MSEEHFKLIEAEYYKLLTQRDELLAALKIARDELVSCNEDIGWRDGEWESVKVCNAAIAKVEQS